VRYFSLISIILLSCNPPSLDRESQRIVKKELESRKIIKATDGDILAAAQATGNLIAAASQEALSTELMKAFKDRGLLEAIKYCNLKAIPVTDSLGSEYKAVIRRTSLNTRNPENDPGSLEEEILEAYQFTHDNNQQIGENVQMLNDEILYTKPIVINNALCLNCHGTPGKELLPENHEVIKGLYPDDNAVGYSMGDLRGMWSIRLSKKEIIKSLQNSTVY
jgi:hypothetical protein